MERLTGNNVDRSEYTSFGSYNLYQYWDKQDLEENLRIRRYLGVSHRVGSVSCCWILSEKGKVIARTTVHHVTKDEAATDYLQNSIGHYHKCLAEAFGRGDHYARNLYVIEGFTDDDLPKPYKTY